MARGPYARDKVIHLQTAAVGAAASIEAWSGWMIASIKPGQWFCARSSHSRHCGSNGSRLPAGSSTQATRRCCEFVKMSAARKSLAESPAICQLIYARINRCENGVSHRRANIFCSISRRGLAARRQRIRQLVLTAPVTPTPALTIRQRLAPANHRIRLAPANR